MRPCSLRKFPTVMHEAAVPDGVQSAIMALEAGSEFLRLCRFHLTIIYHESHRLKVSELLEKTNACKLRIFVRIRKVFILCKFRTLRLF